jgi:hypothetical protein
LTKKQQLTKAADFIGKTKNVRKVSKDESSKTVGINAETATKIELKI